jgi:hypothetical protein
VDSSAAHTVAWQILGFDRLSWTTTIEKENMETTFTWYIYVYIYIYVQELASVHTKGGRGRSALVKSSGHLNNLQLMSTTFYNFSDA